MMRNWRKATWAIAIWSGFIALSVFAMIATIIVQPPEERVGADLAIMMMVLGWCFGMIFLGPIWLLSRPKVK